MACLKFYSPPPKKKKRCQYISWVALKTILKTRGDFFAAGNLYLWFMVKVGKAPPWLLSNTSDFSNVYFISFCPRTYRLHVSSTDGPQPTPICPFEPETTRTQKAARHRVAGDRTHWMQWDMSENSALALCFSVRFPFFTVWMCRGLLRKPASAGNGSNSRWRGGSGGGLAAGDRGSGHWARAGLVRVVCITWQICTEWCMLATHVTLHTDKWWFFA